MTDVFNGSGGATGGDAAVPAGPAEAAIGSGVTGAPDLSNLTPPGGDLGNFGITSFTPAADIGTLPISGGSGGGSSLLASALSGPAGGSGVNVPSAGGTTFSPPPAITPAPGASTITPGGPASVAAAIPNASGEATADQTLAPPVTPVTAEQSWGVTNPVNTSYGLPPGFQNPSTPALGSSGILHQILSKNGLKDITGLGSIGLGLLQAMTPAKGLKSLEGLAGQDAALANTYSAEAQAEGQGLLPAGAEAAVQNNLNAQIAAIRTNYAKMGMSGSSAETQDINAAKSQALAQTFEIGNTLAQQGLQEVQSASGQESTLLNDILNANMNADSALAKSLAGLAGAATDGGYGGNPSGQTFTLTPTPAS